MDQAKKSISEIDEKHNPKSDIDKKLDKIMFSFNTKYMEWSSGKQSGSSFNTKYMEWSSGKQSGSSSKHGNPSTDGDSSPTRNSSSIISKKGRPKVNRVETSSKLPDHDIRGFINETLFLKNFLLKQKESEEFKTLAIVGKNGVGKTTLCQAVFNNQEVKEAYFPRIWVSMYSEETKKEEEDPKIDVVKRILRSLGVEDEMLKAIKTEAVEEQRIKDEAGEREEETVKEKELSRLLNALHLNLIKKKYLIVLDDVWEDNEWNQRLDDEKNQHEKTHLSCGFPKGFGGRVIMTSIDKRLAKEIVGEEENLLHLFPRSDAESVWEIYKDAAKEALKIEVTPRYPGRFKQELMDKSCGIPLAARMLAKFEPVKMDESRDMERKKSF